jgi:heat shock protein HtpX
MWEQIRANRRRSALLITFMAVVLVLMGYTAGEWIVGPGGGAIGLLVGLVIWAVQMMVYLTSAESILLDQGYARELKREDSPRLFNIVDEMRLASGLEYTPHIYLVDDPAPNAFAVGRKPETSAIAVTSGLVQRLNRDELQGVIGHEMAHLKNRDVQFMTLAAIMLGSIVILAEIVRRWTWYGGRGRSRSESRGGGGQAQAIIVLVGLVFAILGPLMAQLLYFACSRKREFLSDACAAQFTRYPEGLASALQKISQAAVTSTYASKATAPMFIVNPLYAGGEEPNSVFSSHPSTAERIRILRGMSGASLADYEEAYHHAMGGSGLIGKRSLASAPKETVRAPSNEGPIETHSDTKSMVRRAHGYMSLHCNCGLDIDVPEGYERNEIRCIRCGSVLPIPAAAPPVMSGPAATSPQPPLLYTRTRQGWDSFRCACGRTIQISPAFAAPFIHCANCGRQIAVTS